MIQSSWPHSSSSKVPPSGYCVGGSMARIALGQAFCDPRTGWTPQVPLLREQLSDTSESPLSGAVLPILQLGKLRLPKLSRHPNPGLSHCGACVLLGVCVCVCAHTTGTAVRSLGWDEPPLWERKSEVVSSGRACFFLSGGNATCEGGGVSPLPAPGTAAS